MGIRNRDYPNPKASRFLPPLCRKAVADLLGMKSSFLDQNFLLSTETGRTLYHECARDLPIIDYHCHLSPAEIAINRRFSNLTEIWLEGDHYKWRAMRSNGIPEKYCTGDADPYEKFLAFARTVPRTLRNPIYHWSHLELQRYFGIHELLNETSAQGIWEKANERLMDSDFCVHGIFKNMKVSLVCTTDDPVDSLEHHATIRESGCPAKILPAFRPDKSGQLLPLEDWNRYVDSLAGVSGKRCDDLDGFMAALAARHAFFHEMGCRLSDHGLCHAPDCSADADEAAVIFRRAREGDASLTPWEEERFAGFLLVQFGKWDHAKGWVQQFHLGAQRNNSSRHFRTLGRDTGFDSIGDWPQAGKLAALLDAMDRENSLPKTILYNLNPADNYVFGTMIGNFNDGTAPGKIQWGSGWWFLDQLEGMEWQINALGNLGLLPRFVGMLTDSRSFLSYPRHEYFRRILCDLFGRDVEAGRIPADDELLRETIQNICHENAKNYFPFWDADC